MARIRTIKPEFFLHEGLYDLEMETGLPVRLAYVGLWCQADREGRFKWEPRKLKSQVLPFDEGIDFEEVLDAFAGEGLIVKYEVDGDVYACIPSWNRNQAINSREASSRLPDIDGTRTHVFARVRISKNIPKQIRLKILARDGNKCVQCGETNDLTIDHIIPKSCGGDHSEENLRTLCRPCNSGRPVNGKALDEDIARARTCTHAQGNARTSGREGKGREGNINTGAFGHVSDEILKDTSRLLEWRQANLGIPPSDADALFVVSAAERALEKGDNPSALFVQIVKGNLRTHLTCQHEDRAAARLKAVRSRAGPSEFASSVAAATKRKDEP
jgi:hypothetical protein